VDELEKFANKSPAWKITNSKPFGSINQFGQSIAGVGL
jgi:hypothetical protein